MVADVAVMPGPAGHPEAEAILEWPDEFVGGLRPRLLAVHRRAALAADELADLRARGLVDGATGRPTDLGRSVIDLLVREEWQEGDEFAAMLREAVPAAARASVLEVGCSTGRRLRRLEVPPGGRRVGV